MKNFLDYLKESITIKDASYKKWKKENVTYRGMKSVGVANKVFGSFGNGLYTVPLSNKAMAKQYGTVFFVVGAIPKNPKIVNSLNDAEILRQSLIVNFCKKNKHDKDYDPGFFEQNTSMEKELIKLGFDGLIIKGREMVNYKPPKNINYFEKESQLIDYYEKTIAK